MKKLLSENKNKKILILIIALIIILIIIGFSYAFLTPHGTGNGLTPFNVTGESLDQFIFDAGDPLSLTPGSHNLYDGQGNIVTESTSTATLISSNPSVGVYAYYDVYIDITKNTYIYSDGSTPELILEVFDGNGNEVKDITNLNFVTINGIDGFDITTAMGIYYIQTDKRMESKSSDGVTDSWTFKITMINLDINQDANQLKTIEGNIVMETDNNKEYKLLAETILNKDGGIDAVVAKGTPEYTNNTISTEYEGLYALEDDYGMSYYYRGIIDDNWVLYGGFYWRIIRINGDGSIRLLYSGSDIPEVTEILFSTDYTKSSIGKNFYNEHVSGRYELLGYMFDYNLYNGNRFNSNVKTFLDTWYENNLIYYEKYLSDTLFCNDRSMYSSYGVPLQSLSWDTYYGSQYRFNNNIPSLMCPNQQDALTVDDEVHGNGELIYPIGLITADEVYLYNYIMNTYYSYTMSPFRYYNSYANVYVYSNNVALTQSSGVSSEHYVRPVVNLKANTLITGTGEYDDPYIVRGLE